MSETLYRVSNNKITIGLVSDDAPPFAKWAIGKETYHVLRWFRQHGFKVQSKRLETANDMD